MVAPQEVQSVDEALTVQLKGRTVKPLGVRPGKDPKSARDALERLLTTASEIRLVPDEGGVYLEYVAMVDRTGPIWLDAGHVLIGQKMAVVEKGVSFSRRAAYEATQARAEQNRSPRYPNE